MTVVAPIATAASPVITAAQVLETRPVVATTAQVRPISPVATRPVVARPVATSAVPVRAAGVPVFATQPGAVVRPQPAAVVRPVAVPVRGPAVVPVRGPVVAPLATAPRGAVIAAPVVARGPAVVAAAPAAVVPAPAAVVEAPVTVAAPVIAVSPTANRYGYNQTALVGRDVNPARTVVIPSSQSVQQALMPPPPPPQPRPYIPPFSQSGVATPLSSNALPPPPPQPRCVTPCPMPCSVQPTPCQPLQPPQSCNQLWEPVPPPPVPCMPAPQSAPGSQPAPPVCTPIPQHAQAGCIMPPQQHCTAQPCLASGTFQQPMLPPQHPGPIPPQQCTYDTYPQPVMAQHVDLNQIPQPVMPHPPPQQTVCIPQQPMAPHPQPVMANPQQMEVHPHQQSIMTIPQGMEAQQHIVHQLPPQPVLPQPHPPPVLLPQPMLTSQLVTPAKQAFTCTDSIIQMTPALATSINGFATPVTHVITTQPFLVQSFAHTLEGLDYEALDVKREHHKKLKYEHEAIRQARDLEFLRTHKELEEMKLKAEIDASKLQREIKEREMEIERLHRKQCQASQTLERLVTEREAEREQEEAVHREIDSNISILEEASERQRQFELDIIKRRLREQTELQNALTTEKARINCERRDLRARSQGAEVALQRRVEELRDWESHLEHQWLEIQDRRKALEHVHCVPNAVVLEQPVETIEHHHYTPFESVHTTTVHTVPVAVHMSPMKGDPMTPLSTTFFGRM